MPSGEAAIVLDELDRPHGGRAYERARRQTHPEISVHVGDDALLGAGDPDEQRYVAKLVGPEPTHLPTYGGTDPFTLDGARQGWVVHDPTAHDDPSARPVTVVGLDPEVAGGLFGRAPGLRAVEGALDR